MALYPGQSFYDPGLQFFDDDGDPLAGGFLYFYQAGTSTPQDTFNDSDLAPGHENANPIELDAAGRAPNAIFLKPTGYKIILQDANLVTIWTRDEIEEVGQVFANTFGILQGTGRTVTSGSLQLTTDRLVQVDSTATNPSTFGLLQAGSWVNMLAIKNIGTNPVRVSPNGTDTLENVNTYFTITAASGGVFPTKIFVSDGVSAIYVLNIS